jgi:hypothetical protein
MSEIKPLPKDKKSTARNPFADFLPFPIAPIMLSPQMLIAEGRVFRAVLVLAFFIG